MRGRRSRGVRARLRRGGGGFTLIELMIALALGLLLVAALLGGVVTSASTGRTRDRAADLQVNGRYAIELIKRELQHAGHLGGAGVFSPDAPAAFAVSNVCDAALLGRLSIPVWGADDSNPFSGTCLPASQYLAGDVFVVRRLSSLPAVPPTAADRIYYRTAYEGGEYFTGANAPSFSGSNRQPPYVDYLLEETVFYVSPYTRAPDESPRVPALYRMRLGAGPAMTAELVAGGVENLQVRYGVVDAATGATQYVDAAAVADWQQVNALEISLLVRAPAAEPSYQNTRTYQLGDHTVQVNDGVRRLVFSSVVQLRNGS